MKLPEFDLEALAKMRLQECQGTLIGGMVVAKRHGCGERQYGQEMMELQNVRWSSVAGNLDRIAGVFHQHYQTTYGFGERLQVTLDKDELVFSMPPIAQAAAYQLAHWNATAEQLHEVQRGFWLALEKNCGVRVELLFGAEQDQVRVRRK